MQEISRGMIEYFGIDNVMRAFLAKPVSSARCFGLVLVHEIWGLNRHVQELACEFARNGLAVLVPDLYSSSAVTQAVDEMEIKEITAFSDSLERNSFSDCNLFAGILPAVKEKIQKVKVSIEEGVISREKLIREVVKASRFLSEQKFTIPGKVRIIYVKPAG